MSLIITTPTTSHLDSLDPEITDFILKNCPQDFVPHMTLLKTTTIFNIDVLKNNEKCIVNLSRLNNIRRINKFVEAVNRKLIIDGVFIGCAETIAARHEKLVKKYHNIGYLIILPIDFVYKRVLPKLPWFKNLYFIITKGHNRVMSKAEILGRLVSCGFRIENVENISDKIYFAVRKVSDPAYDMNASYGPLFKMRRIGKDKKIIHVYKFRTMHPYAEYLQEYITEQNKLAKSGKIANDYRITSWGKVFRKMWIDELPMLLNLLKGDLKLFGVRPLSNAYFNRYPTHLQELRTKTKPGLIPPYYADLPESWEEILESEEKYLKNYFKHPFLTDINYLRRALYNIIIKGKRSG